MRLIGQWVWVSVVLLEIASCAAPAGARRQAGRLDVRSIEQDTFRRVNRQRRDHGLAPLDWNESLAVVARQHSQRMAEAGFFSHTDPATGDLASRLNRAGIRWSVCEENIFSEKGYEDPVSKAVESWMKSSGHRKNILDHTVSQTAVGIALAGDGTVYFTQEFTRP